MAARSRAEAAGLAHQVWLLVCALAEHSPGEFTAERRGDTAGWLWEGTGAALMRRAAPEVPEADRRRAKEYLQATQMIVNVSGGALPAWFIRRDWHGGPPAHVHVMAQEQPRRPQEAGLRLPAPAPAPGGGGLAKAVRELVSHAAAVEAEAGSLQAENERLRREAEELRADRDRLVAENIRLQDTVRQISELLAEHQELGRVPWILMPSWCRSVQRLID